MSKEYFISLYGEAGIEIIRSPPRYTTIRVNTLQITMQSAVDYIKSLYPSYDVKIHHLIPDLLVIPVNGPFERERKQNAVFVDTRCGEAVLRGSHIYVPGVMGVSDRNCIYSLCW